MIRILTHDVFMEHKPWFYHPERPERLTLILNSIAKYLGDKIVIEKPSVKIDKSLARLIHDEKYIARVERISEKGRGMLDADTYVCSKTLDAALTALAITAQAVRELLEKKSGAVVVLPRPPGHHAGYSGAAMGAPTLGFCIFNTSALASKVAVDLGARVVHIDFDLHHGNGTQEILYREPRVIHIDFHQDPSTIYPGTGWPWQNGEGEAVGTKLNIILPPGAGDDAFEKAVVEVVGKVVEVYGRPDLLVFSAGFDSYRGDGLGGLRATSKTFYMMGSLVKELTGNPPVIAVWEGGYGAGLERGAPAFVAGLIGMGDPVGDKPSSSGLSVLSEVERVVKEVIEAL